MSAAGLDLLSHHEFEILFEDARGRLHHFQNLLETHKVFDLASLTKIVFTVTALARFDDQNPKEKLIERAVSDFLPWWPKANGTTVKNLLTHTSGLPAHVRFYESLSLDEPVPYRWQELKSLLVAFATQEKGKRVGRASRRSPIQQVYSDLGFLLLAYVLEEIHQSTLKEVYQEMSEDGWLPGLSFFVDPSEAVPTGYCSFRKRQLQGEVHDENAFALGSVAPHAGLFGNAFSVLSWWRNLQNRLSARVLKTFTTQNRVGDFSLGFMRKSKSGPSSAGHFFSESSFGHLGFTGTSFWHDPKDKKTVVFLMNATWPKRKDPSPAKVLRPLVHDWLYQEWGGEL